LEHAVERFHGVEVPLEQSSSQGQAFHPTLSFPNCQNHGSVFPEAILHHQLSHSEKNKKNKIFQITLINIKKKFKITMGRVTHTLIPATPFGPC
jgi:hypothetical protein